ncbi:hypothetical protein Tco_0579943, partial [Tanacetum coccineum]
KKGALKTKEAAEKKVADEKEKAEKKDGVEEKEVTEKKKSLNGAAKKKDVGTAQTGKKTRYNIFIIIQ